MSNTWYPLAKRNYALSSILSDNVKALLVDTGAYTYSAAHEFLSDIPSGARVAASANLSSKTLTVVANDVTFDCADYTITVGVSQPSCEALVYYVDTGVVGTSRLLVFDDTFSSGMPYTPPAGGGDVAITVHASGVGTL